MIQFILHYVLLSIQNPNSPKFMRRKSRFEMWKFSPFVFVFFFFFFLFFIDCHFRFLAWAQPQWINTSLHSTIMLICLALKQFHSFWINVVHRNSFIHLNFLYSMYLGATRKKIISLNSLNIYVGVVHNILAFLCSTSCNLKWKHITPLM